MSTYEYIILGAGTIGLTLARYLAENNVENFIVLDVGIQSEFEQELAIAFTDEIYSGAIQGRRFGVGGTSQIWGGAFSIPSKKELENLLCPIDGTLLDFQDENIKKLASYFDIQIRNSNANFMSTKLYKTEVLWPHFSKRNTKRFIKKYISADKVITPRFVQGISALSGSNLVHTIGPGNKDVYYNGKNVICCLGALETTRLLMKSCDDRSILGRNFHDHLSIKIADGTINNKRLFFRDYFMKLKPWGFSSKRFVFDVEGISGFVHFAPKRREGGLFDSIREKFSALQRGEMNLSLNIKLSSIKEFLVFSYHLIRYQVIVGDITDKFEVYLVIDQSTIPDTTNNFLELKDEKLTINWNKKFDHQELEPVINKILLDLCGPFTVKRTEIEIQSMVDIFHPAGTTPISATKSTGSVSAFDGQVYGLKNVYVCSTSMLPKVGTFSPTGVCLMAGLEMLSRKLKLLNEVKNETKP
jgi:hypothetical protein